MCGKELEECATWPGLWVCPDYKQPINLTAPFQYKCRGMEIEERAIQAFDKEMRKLIGEMN